MSLSDVKTVNAGFSNSDEWIKVTYDFSVDSGASADYDVFYASDDMLLTDFYAKVISACSAAAGSAVIDCGIGDGGTEIWSDKAVTALDAVGDVAYIDSVGFVKISSGQTMVMGIETEDLVSGKIDFNFKLKKF